ncbi:MAG TPA: PKD domain-containing protein [Methanoregulaceae archaeon]|nr:PKD domain-containing protein [Methanoregulaceae archaeon]
MKPALNCNTLIMLLVFVIASGTQTGITFADCNGPPCPFSPVVNTTSCGSCGCGADLSICSVAGTCAFNTLPVDIGMMIPGIATSTLSGPAPLSVQFRDTAGPSEGTASWTWDFGDGSTGTGVSPVHVYQVPGTYNVTLSVSRGESNGNLEWGLSGTTRRTAVITVTPGATVQQQAASPLIVQGSNGAENSVTKVYSPPSGFTVPDISHYQEGFAKSAVPAGTIIHVPAGNGIYGY